MEKREFLKLLGLCTLMGTGSGHAASTLHPNNQCAQDTPPTKEKDSVYDRVMKSGKIRCGYTPYSVGLNHDLKKGGLYGIYKDIIETAAKKLELAVEWTEEIGWGQQIAGLNNGRYDIIASPVSITGPRSRSADFTIPLYYSPVWAWVRSDNDSFDDKSWPAIDKPSSTLCVMDGEQTEAIAKFYFPSAKRLSIPQNSDFSLLMQNVVTGKADLTFAEPLSVYEFMEQNPNSLRQIKGDEPLTLVPNVMMIKRGESEFKSMVDNILGEMFLGGIIDKAIDRYEKYPNSYVRAEADF